ncbi:MAG: SusE domain-containing protein [Sediminibacterium sp.]
MYRQNLTMLILVSLVLFSCQKELVQPGVSPSVQPQQQQSKLQVSSTSVVLSQSKAAEVAIRFNWTAFGGQSEETGGYTIEADLTGSGFSNAIEVGSTYEPSISFTTQELNQQLRKVMMADTRELVEFRIKANGCQSLYSTVVVVSATAYQPYSLFDETQIMRLPGNYEDWSIPNAPRVVSTKRNGQFEGFVNFTDAKSQFYLVKGTQWDNVTTYNQTGANTLGFNGTFFNVNGGAGINKVSVNMNTMTWSCTKINSFGLFGTATGAAGTDAEMTTDASNISWKITKDLVKGEFVFRANKSNDIVFGHNENSGTCIADANGEKITISQSGNYTIVLTLSAAGNYSYGIRKNK